MAAGPIIVEGTEGTELPSLGAVEADVLCNMDKST